MFSSTVYPELKAVVFNKDTRKSTKITWQRNESLGETSEAERENRVDGAPWDSLKQVSQPTGYLNVLSQARKHQSTIAT